MPAANATSSRISRASLVAVPPLEPDDREAQLQRLAGFLVAAANTNAPAQARERQDGEPPPPSQVRPVAAPSAGVTESSDDAELVHAWRRGEPGAAKAIWRKYAVLVRAKLRRSVGSHDLDDHVQDVFSRLFESLAQLRDPAALRSFLIGITMRVAGTEHRRRACRWWPRLTSTGDLHEVPGPSTYDVDAWEALARFFGVLDKIGPHGRRVFELRYVEEKELVEVARAMNISLATAKRHLARTSARVFALVEREPALTSYYDTSLLRTRPGYRETARDASASPLAE